MADMETANDLMATFASTVSAGFDALQGPVNSVFGLMIALVVALTGIQWALSPGRDLLTGAFSKVLLIGAFAYLINDWQTLSETFQAGFIDLGLMAGGGSMARSDFLNPGAVLEAGWRIVKALGETPAPVNNPLDVAGNFTDALILGLAMIGVMLAFAVLALQIIVTLLEFKIVTLGGLILLPFGVWSKSAFLAERPLGYVAAAGLKVLALAIVISLAQSIFEQLQPSENPDLYEALAVLAASLLLAMLAIFIPNLAAALVTGGPSLGAGAALTGTLATGGAAALGFGLAVGAGRALSSGLAATFRTAAGPGSTPPPSPAAGSPPRSPPPSPSPPSSFSPAGSASPAPSSAAETFGPPRRQETIAREAAQAKSDFHRAAGGKPPGGARPSRAGALQAFFAANAARSLLPGQESSGSVSPQLKPREP